MQTTIECHGLDTPDRVCFYEQDFYVLSNFSAFNLRWKGHVFPTLEHAYHWEKFPEVNQGQHLKRFIANAPSAHEAFKLAQEAKECQRRDWNEIKVDVMRDLLRAKASQHEYVRRKLLATGNRELVENSWRDDFWGWGPNRDGKNMLGRLWMEVRAEIRNASNLQLVFPDAEFYAVPKTYYKYIVRDRTGQIYFVEEDGQYRNTNHMTIIRIFNEK